MDNKRFQKFLGYLSKSSSHKKEIVASLVSKYFSKDEQLVFSKELKERLITIQKNLHEVKIENEIEELENNCNRYLKLVYKYYNSKNKSSTMKEDAKLLLEKITYTK